MDVFIQLSTTSSHPPSTSNFSALSHFSFLLNIPVAHSFFFPFLSLKRHLCCLPVAIPLESRTLIPQFLNEKRINKSNGAFFISFLLALPTTHSENLTSRREAQEKVHKRVKRIFFLCLSAVRLLARAGWKMKGKWRRVRWNFSVYFRAGVEEEYGKNEWVKI